MRLPLWLLARLVPAACRDRWLEEWRAELGHGRWTMLFGALPDAIAMRRLPAKAGSHENHQRHLWLPPLGGSSPSGGRKPSLFHAFPQDVRYALRGICASRTFSISVIASLAVGIAATSASFAFLHAVMFRTFPGVTDQDTLVRVLPNRSCGWRGCTMRSSTPADYEILRESLPSLQGLSASASAVIAVRIGPDAHAIRGAVVSTNYFDVLGVRPVLGRGFAADEGAPAAGNVAVIGYTLWQRMFGARADVLGQFIEVAGRPVRIVGVLPKFGGLVKSAAEIGAWYGTEIWVPLPFADLVLPRATAPGGGTLPSVEYRFDYVGRLKTGGTIEGARSDAAVANARLAAAHPAGYDEGSVAIEGVWVNDPRQATLMLGSFMIVPMLVLAIACVNAANLLLTRGSLRARDVAVRMALGATRWRVVRQLLTESLMLALAAGALAFPLISWLLDVGEAAVGIDIPIDKSALTFTIAASLFCAVGCGLTPALRAVSRRTLALGSTRPGDASRRDVRGRRALVALQVALSLGLLATGGQTVGAVRDLYESTGAARPDELVLASFDLDQLKFQPAAGEEFYRRLLDSASHIPGVESAALARRSALWTWGRGKGSSPIIAWRVEDAPRDGVMYLGGYVAGDLFKTVGLPVVEGRSFQPEDFTPRATVAIVSRAFAVAKLNGVAVGRTIRVAANNQTHAESVEVRIVGVIEPATDLGYSKKALPTVYVASPLEYEPALTLYLRSRRPLDDVLPALNAAIRQIDARVPITEVATLEALTSLRYFEERTMAQALTLLGVIALALATAGLYAVVSFIVTLRQRELGVRMALGASPSGILKLVLRQSMTLAMAGGIFGAVIAVISGALIHANILGAPSLDVRMFAAAAGVLTLAMFAASIVPARRAARVDPITVLRQE